MKRLLSISLLLFFSCSPKGYWLSENSYRAKNPNYKLASKKFIKTDLIDINFIYLSLDSLITRDKVFKSAIGFTDDGQAFLNSLEASKINIENVKKNSINTAQEIGYYRVNAETILFERLTSSDFGQYILWKGEIDGDTLTFTYKNWPNNDRVFKYIKSNLPAN